MNFEMNASNSWWTKACSELKHHASRKLEALCPTVFWKMRVWRLRRNLSECELQIAPFLCDRRKVSVDAGASEGAYSVNICDYSANCIAFEPRRDQAQRIRDMASAAGLGIGVEAVALSDVEGVAQLRVLTNDPGRSTIESANKLEDSDGSPQTTMPISTMRLDDYKLPQVGFIKIDVEGHELAALRGAKETIESSMPNLLVEIEERHRKGAIKEVSSFLGDLGYEGFFILRGEAQPLVQFNASVHQNPANVGSWKDGWMRRGVYVNNFFFLPACGGSTFRMLVSSIGLKDIASNAKTGMEVPTT